MTADTLAYRYSYTVMVTGSLVLCILGQLPAIRAVMQNW